MTGIFNGIQTILNLLNGALKYLLLLIRSIKLMIQNMITTVTNTIGLVSGIPTWLAVYAMVAIGFIVLARLIGREIK